MPKSTAVSREDREQGRPEYEDESRLTREIRRQDY